MSKRKKPSSRHAVLFLKPDTPQTFAVATRALALFEKAGITPLLAESHQDDALFAASLRGVPTISADRLPDSTALALAIGGDGTYLFAASRLYGADVPMCGVNLGQVGFLTDCTAADMAEHIECILGGTAQEKKRPFFTATVERTGKEVFGPEPFLNDAVLQRSAHEKMLRLDIALPAANVGPLRADGLIIATPTGSTAYALSAGGLPMHPSLDALMLVPVSPHALGWRPVVIPPREVRVTVMGDHGQLGVDGRRFFTLRRGDVVCVRKSPHVLRHFDPAGESWFDRMRHRLRWGGGPL